MPKILCRYCRDDYWYFPLLLPTRIFQGTPGDIWHENRCFFKRSPTDISSFFVVTKTNNFFREVGMCSSVIVVTKTSILRQAVIFL